MIRNLVTNMHAKNYTNVHQATNDIMEILRQPAAVVLCQGVTTTKRTNETKAISLYIDRHPNTGEDMLCGKGDLVWDFDEYIADVIDFNEITVYESTLVAVKP